MLDIRNLNYKFNDNSYTNEEKRELYIDYLENKLEMTKTYKNESIEKLISFINSEEVFLYEILNFLEYLEEKNVSKKILEEINKLYKSIHNRVDDEMQEILNIINDRELAEFEFECREEQGIYIEGVDNDFINEKFIKSNSNPESVFIFGKAGSGTNTTMKELIEGEK